MATGVASSSVIAGVDVLPSADALRGPILGLRSRVGSFLLGSPVVPRTLCENLLTVVGLPNRPGPDLGPGVAFEGRGPGVICNLRTGESGLGCDVRGGFFPIGLAARPGPTDLLKFGSDGVGGVKFVEFWFASFSPPAVDMVGVIGNELAAEVGGESRLTALDRGKKMPAPGLVVVKYDMLVRHSSY
jgi:hypothetical protein